MELVWYASYGSNLLQSRFNCYIQGGIPVGSTKFHLGCADKTLPLKGKSVSIPATLYFAQHSKSWEGGGVAFIDENFNTDSFVAGRMYLITMQQFIEVVMQENDMDSPFSFELNRLIKNKSIVFDENSWYGKVLFLGTEGGYPILTFTNPNHNTNSISSPKDNYLITIIKGLKECYNWSNEQLIDYLGRLEGIKGFMIEERIENLVNL